MPFTSINTSLPVGLFFSQSNGLPQGSLNEGAGGDYNYTHPALIWRYTETSAGVVNGDGASPLNAWHRHILTGLVTPTGNRFGIERTFVEDAWCHLIVVSKGATKLNGNWLPAQSEHVTLVAQVDAALAAAGRSALDFAVWIQGEGDTNVEADSLAYEANLGTLFSDVRTRWGASLPIVLVYLHVNNTGTFEANVRAGQESYVAGDANCYGVDPDAVSAYDGAHYDTDGLIGLAPLIRAPLVTAGVLP